MNDTKERGAGGLTAFVDDVEGGVCDVVIFEEVFGRAGERAHEDRVVLRGDEGDGGKAQVELSRHRKAHKGGGGSAISLLRRLPVQYSVGR